MIAVEELPKASARLADVLRGDPDLPSLKEARTVYGTVRAALGLNPTPGQWFTAPSDSYKFRKTQVPTYGLSLLPNWIAKDVAVLHGLEEYIPFLCDVCGNSSRGCREVCLNSAGRGLAPSVQLGRAARTLFLMAHPTHAMRWWLEEQRKVVARHGVVGHRPNVFADIVWECVYPRLLLDVRGLMHYDYTKHWWRTGSDNYHLTFSADERRSLSDIRSQVASGRNVAVVVRCGKNEPKPSSWAGLPAVDGDDPEVGDSRFLDPRGCVVLLSPKGKARRSKSSFIWPLTVSEDS